jgi:hypothetical protein
MRSVHGRERGSASSQMQKLSAHKEEAARMERPFFALSESRDFADQYLMPPPPYPPKR